MKKVSVVVGGNSGIGFAAAQILGREYSLLIAGSNQEKIEEALHSLREDNIDAVGIICDVSDRNQVQELAEKASALGEIANVIHAAGIAPGRFDARRVLEVNALGVAYSIEAFYPKLTAGSVMITISSTAPYTIPSFVPPTEVLRLNPLEPDFLTRTLALCEAFKYKASAGMAYVYSKWFVSDYTTRNAMRFGKKGVRILSVSPGTTMTPFYYNGAKESGDKLLDKTPIGRHGRPEELAELIAFLVSSNAGFMTGADILCDGGIVSGLNLPQVE